MFGLSVKKSLYRYLLLLLVFGSVSNLCAQTIIESGAQSAGFHLSTDVTDSVPVIHYQRHVHMLSSVDDRVSLKVFGDGRVEVHFPVYMKKAGDYEMTLERFELVALIRAFSSNGIMDFNKKAVKARVYAHKKREQKNNAYYAISDSVESDIKIRLNQYQKNSVSRKSKNFKADFKWKNIEHAAARYSDITELSRANQSVLLLKELMTDARLKRSEP